MKTIDKIVNKISSGWSIFSYIAMVLVMLLITVDVILRKVAHITIVGSYEIVERCLLVLVFCGFAYGQTNHAHIHVTLFLTMFSKKVSLFLYGVWHVLSFIGAVLTGYAMILQMQYAISAGTWTPVLQIALWPFYLISAIGMFIFALTIIWDAVQCFVGLGVEEWDEKIRSAWS